MIEEKVLQRLTYEALETVDAILVEPPVISSGEIRCVVSVDVGSTVLRLTLRGQWPMTRLPNVYMDPSIAKHLAHVSYIGEVCYSDHEGEDFSTAEDNTGHLLAHVVAKAKNTLEESFSLRATGDYSDLLNELEGYWASLDGAQLVYMAVEPALNIQLYAGVRTEKERRSVVWVDAGSSELGSLQRTKVSTMTLPANWLPPSPGEKWKEGWLSALLDEGESQGVDLRKRGYHVLLCRQERPSGGFSYFGLSYKVAPGPQARMIDISPFGVQRTWREFLLNRVGGNALRKRVAVLGCGALGGRIAEQLALIGVDELVLIDPEKFSSDNIFRHVLGKRSIGLFKAEELAREIREKRIGAKVFAHAVSAQEWLRAHDERHQCEVLVLATGNLALERSIVRRGHEECWPQIIISGWIEPFGLGGHVVSSRPGYPGCLECLHTVGGEVSAAPKVGFLALGQKFTQNLTGCGGAFIPYSPLAATRTATLVCDMVISEKVGYRCWAGTSSQAMEKGMNTTEWYSKCAAGGADGSDIDISERDCPCCAS